MANVMNLDGSVYHWWLNRMEPGERRLWRLSPAIFPISHLLFQGKASGCLLNSMGG